MNNGMKINQRSDRDLQQLVKSASGLENVPRFVKHAAAELRRRALARATRGKK